MKKIILLLIILLLVSMSTVVLADDDYDDDHEDDDDDDHYYSNSRHDDDHEDDDDDWDVSNDFFLETPVVEEIVIEPIVIEPLLVVENNQTQEDQKITEFVDLSEKISSYKNSSKNISVLLNQTNSSQNDVSGENIDVSGMKQMNFIQRLLQYFFGGKK